MPLIHYECACGNFKAVFLRHPKDAEALLPCTKCGEKMKKQLKAPSSTSKIVMDNGFQARAVEINPEIVEINEKRSEKDYKED